MSYTLQPIRQNETAKRLFAWSILAAFLLTCSSAYSQSVVIYEDIHVAGRSKTLPIGDYRLTAFSGITSSIRVPKGLVANIYEHADDGGGYGIWVDLLEDQQDLSKFGLNKKVSYISVFSANRQGFFWARNSVQNGQFVPGHWERNRAGGNP